MKNFMFHPGIKPKSPALQADSFFFFFSGCNFIHFINKIEFTPNYKKNIF